MLIHCFHARRGRRFVLAVMAMLLFAVILRLASVQAVPAMAQEDGTITLPILMYHHMLKEEKRLGKYVISPEELEQDLRTLQQRGYTTISPEELAAWCRGQGDLPEKPVMLTFDDGYLSTFVYALPILEQYQAKAVVSCVGSYTDRFTNTPDPNLNYGHMTWDDVSTLAASPLISIGNHSYDMHHTEGRKGIAMTMGESVEHYRAALYDDVYYMQGLLQEHLNEMPITFTYPFGAMSEQSQPIIQEMGFTVGLTCLEKINYLSGDIEELQTLCRYNRPHGMDINKILDLAEG